ncbi:Cytidylate kinase [Candidatus Cyrtobacter comes]|uniref:Cytidylate kinase n=1 Tax=Candidatus Cyrtobacter comes TaxID=675776 RepID=A0ABU5L838_9RICK|nr:(d)CMP kinase [Candidatus Cyrtobacter comes]MDZ5762288.1 Cytidylate kinase [Candidatus Cyrtobacter comes]
MLKPFIVAIDGRAASGKGTISHIVAEKLGLDWLNTGLLYRAVAFIALKGGISIHEYKELVQIAQNISLSDLEESHLYASHVGRFASIISSVPEVRQALFYMQRSFPVGKKGTVIEGRDIGTVIFPDADVKVFVTAELKERARRRFVQLQNRGEKIIYESVLKDLQERDQRDEGRDCSPLQIAKGSIVIDTTDLSVDESVSLVMSRINEVSSF